MASRGKTEGASAELEVQVAELGTELERQKEEERRLQVLPLGRCCLVVIMHHDSTMQ